jgi:hypothetical protein
VICSVFSLFLGRGIVNKKNNNAILMALLSHHNTKSLGFVTMIPAAQTEVVKEGQVLVCRSATARSFVLNGLSSAP